MTLGSWRINFSNLTEWFENIIQILPFSGGQKHRYLVYRLLKFCYVLATSATVLAFFAAATNSTNETNKAGIMCH